MANDNFDQQLDSIRSGAGVVGSPMEVIPSLLRGAFRAPAGYQFVCADISMIEVRVLAWLAQSVPLLQMFREDRDAYKEFATKMYPVSYENVTKTQRQIAKPAVLSCGYGSGGGEWKTEVKTCPKCKGRGCEDCEGQGKTYDPYKSGLWGYAADMGVDMTQEEAHEAVAIYRQSYPEVVEFWYRFEDAIKGLMQNPLHRTATFRCLGLQLVPGKLLRVVLPSGRSLHYLKPELVDGHITYDTEDPKTRQRVRRRLYGSLATENVDQAIARDVLAVGMVRAVDADFTLCGHTHDELLAIEEIGSHRDDSALVSVMTEPIDWAPGLPLKAEGWAGPVYRK